MAQTDELLKLLRHNGVQEFEGHGIKVRFGERASLKFPMADNTPPPKQPETKNKPPKPDEDDPDLFYSTRFGGS